VCVRACVCVCVCMCVWCVWLPVQHGISDQQSMQRLGSLASVGGPFRSQSMLSMSINICQLFMVAVGGQGMLGMLSRHFKAC
jgi:hypothetical protein